MIFNRLIPGNIQKAVAPVRYPFLWNAAIQDHTQWPGFAGNGDTILSLARNLGEVCGVLANFPPQNAWYGIDHLDMNSANFPGLLTLEGLIKKIGPPQWPWTVDSTLADRGQAVFSRSTAHGGCGDRHGIKPVDSSIRILGMAVLGSIEHYRLGNPITCAVDGNSVGLSQRPKVGGLKRLYRLASADAAYESRVLQGIWAAAPYLHNGSVPTLAQLLTPAAHRVKSLAVGPNYDPVNVGLASTRTKFGYTFQATGCSNINSGNSNCGREYGTTLSPSDKAALLEYLETL